MRPVTLDQRTPGAALHPGLRDGEPADDVDVAVLEWVLAALKRDTPTARGVATVTYPPRTA